MWPALLEVPRPAYRGHKLPSVMPASLPSPGDDPAASAAALSASPVLFTGDDGEAARGFMAAMWSREQSITQDVVAAYLAAQATGERLPSPGTASDQSMIAGEAQFVEATSALSTGLDQFDLIMGGWVQQ